MTGLAPALKSDLLEHDPLAMATLPRLRRYNSSGHLFESLEKVTVALAVYLGEHGDDKKVRSDIIDVHAMWTHASPLQRVRASKGIPTSQIAVKLCDYLHDALIFCRQSGLADTGIAVVLANSARYLRSAAGSEVGTPWPRGQGYDVLLERLAAFSNLFDRVREDLGDWRARMEEDLESMSREEILKGLRTLSSWPSDAAVPAMLCVTTLGPHRKELSALAALMLQRSRDELSDSDRALIADDFKRLIEGAGDRKHDRFRKALAMMVLDGAQSPEYHAVLQRAAVQRFKRAVLVGNNSLIGWNSAKKLKVISC